MIVKEYTLNTGKRTFVLALRTSAIAVASLFSLLFLAQSIASSTEAIVAARNEFTALSAQYGTLDRSEHDYETLKGIAEKLEATIPTIDTVPAVEDFLAGSAAKTNVLLSVALASFPAQNTTGTLEELGMTLRVEGGEQSLLSFFNMIETAPYLIAIRDMSLTLTDTGGTLTAHATGVVYLKKQDQ